MRGKCRAQGKDEKKMKNRKHIVVFLLAVSLLLTLAACGGHDDTEINNGQQRYSLEHPEPLPDGMEDTKGYIGDEKYRNDVKLTCTLQSGYEVTLGMGDKDAGSNAVYLNPTCSNPNGAVFYIEAERMMFPQYSTPMELATVKLADFPAMDTNSIAAFQWYEDIMGVDAGYHDVDNYGVAWQDSSLVDGDSGSETLTIKVCDKVTGEELGTVVAHIDYDAENDIYFLADLNEVLDNAA